MGFWSVVVCLTLQGVLTLPAAAEEDRPNIIFFLVDDMGVMDTSVPFLTDANGVPEKQPLNQFFHTPGMERLASQGIRFNQFYAMSVCSPTRITILTGQHAARHRTTNWINPYENNRNARGPTNWNWPGMTPDHPSLPALLKSIGYRTIHIGKSHLGPEPHLGADPTKLGFDINIGGSAIGHPGSYFGMKHFGAGTRNAVPHLTHFHGREIHLTEALTREAKQQIANAAQSQTPFFLHFSHYAVHTPFESDPRFAARYRDSGKSAQAQSFATLVEGMDQSLTEVLDHVERLGIAEETLIFFLGDNGSDAPLGHHHEIACAAPLRGRKGTQYEGGTRVPFIAAWAKSNPNSKLQQRFPIASNGIQPQIASICDLFPTTLALVGLASPDPSIVDGQSLWAMIGGERDAAKPQEFLLHFPHEHRDQYFTSFRQGEWKLIYHYFPQDQPAERRYQLFHLHSDPSESTELSEQEPDQLKAMIKGMVWRLEKLGAIYPEDENGASVAPVLPADESP